MKQIYIVDYLGVHCGMHYYNDAFKDVLSKEGFRVEILSNYSEDDTTEPFFKNQYKGSKLSKVCSLLNNLKRLRRYIKAHNDDVFIYLTYGNMIDIPFMRIISRAKYYVVDIHEAIAQDVDSNLKLKQRFKNLYSRKIRNVISHSSRTDSFLSEYGYSGNCFRVPHFKYVFPKKYDKYFIAAEIFNSVNKSRVNILFFGNLNKSKGVDILIEAVNNLPADIADKINVIIAGKDFDGAVDIIKPSNDRDIRIFKRHISDDELRFLYQNVEYLALPYRKTSQSGILEMAFYFRKPIIASDIPYFHTTLENFPSFGILAGNDSDSYSDTLISVVNSHSKVEYFNDDDYSKYVNRIEVQRFVSDFKHWTNNLD